jgi:nitroreductase
MNFTFLAASRRSTRRYKKNSPIPRDHLEMCMDSARMSPSACNSQPWKFVAVDDALLIEKISKEVLSGTHKMNSFAHNAAAFIAIVSENVKSSAWAGGKLMGTDFKFVDAGIACAHIVLQAEELGIGTCILGWFSEKRLKKILSVPRQKKIKLLIAMGYPEENRKREKQLKPRRDTVSFNSYGTS